MSSQSAFKVGNIVAFKADPSRKGSIIELLSPIRNQYRYRVFHSPDDIREYSEDQITRVAAPLSRITTDTELSPEEFMARLNALRLNNPQTDSIYALHAARIRFIPFQFKPLLRFLRSDRPRLLIADEVGVGKTIEAGLILRELQSRQELGNILIVCPKALVQKWRAEMRRFDEVFQPLTSAQLRYCLRETHLDGVWPSQYSRAIVHLELLRREEYLMGTEGRRPRPGLLTLSPPPQFDLLIVDEAHHVRNPETKSHEVARFLCEVAEAVIFMTATPVQLGAENLFHLLNLLRPDRFIDKTQFQEIVEPNQYLNRSIRHVRTKQPSNTWLHEAQAALAHAATTYWGSRVLKHDPRFSKWVHRLDQTDTLSDEERITFIRDMEDVHTLAHIMNRTRRRDIGRFTIREPLTVSVPFTEEQQRFYDALISYRQQVLALEYDPQVIRLITDMLERQTASCLPALVPALDTFIRTGRFATGQLTDDLDWDNDFDMPRPLIQKAYQLRQMAAALPDEDPKFDQLAKIVSETINGPGPGKVLVFSFFLHTLAYLRKRLQQAGCRVAVVSGQVDEETREVLRARFRLDSQDEHALDVLLSSEVGCEGLDYEFCSRLVNYDIPWNPMRVEQRIGRIDRFGQKSDKVQIYNFITPSTIEERIIFRCYERLGIFRDTIGDMEEVLGELTQALTQTALDPSLTLQQAEEKAQQLADNVLREVEEQRRLEAESTELLGLDRAFLDEVERIQQEGRFVSPVELEQMIGLYLAHRCQNATILGDSTQNKLVRVRANREDRASLLQDLGQLSRQDRQIFEFKRWLEGNKPLLTVTFDQETALERRDIPFITPIHPLTKMAIAHWMKRNTPMFTRLEVKGEDTPAGKYVFAYYLWETVSLRSDVRLLPMIWSVQANEMANSVLGSLPHYLNQARPPATSPSLSTQEMEQVLHKIEEAVHDRRLMEVEQLAETNRQLVEQQLASLARYYRRRLERVAEELDSATNDRIRRMKESELGRIQQEWERKKQAIEDKKKADIISQRVAYGIAEVKQNAE